MVPNPAHLLLSYLSIVMKIVEFVNKAKSEIKRARRFANAFRLIDDLKAIDAQEKKSKNL